MRQLRWFPHTARVNTRWADQDRYNHVNNAHYYAFFDTVINEYLISRGVLDLSTAADLADEPPPIGFCVDSACQFLAPVSYPHPVDVGLRVGHLGTSSVRYELAVFDGRDADVAGNRAGAGDGDGDDAVRRSGPAAVGHFVHVFVDRTTHKPVPLPPDLRAALSKLLVAHV